MCRTADVSLDRYLLAPSRTGRFSWARPGFPTRSVGLARSRLPPCPHSALPEYFAGRRISLPSAPGRPRSAFDASVAIVRIFARYLAGSGGYRVAKAHPVGVGVFCRCPLAVFGARTLVSSRPPPGVSAWRIAAGERAPRAHFARSSAASCDSPHSVSRRSLFNCLSAHMASMWQCIPTARFGDLEPAPSMLRAEKSAMAALIYSANVSWGGIPVTGGSNRGKPGSDASRLP